MTTGKKIGIGLGCALPLVCCLGGFLVLQSTFGKAAGSLDEQIAGAKKEGVPLVPADLKAMLDTTPQQNASPLYRKAMVMLEKDPEIKALTADMGAPKGDSNYARRQANAVANLSKLDPLVAVLEEAAKRDHCIWDRDWGKGFNLLFPEFASMKQMVKLEAFRAEALSKRGDWKGALKALTVGQKIARHSGEEPILIGMLVQIACESIVFASFDKVIAQNRANTAFLAEARKVLDGFGPLPNFKRSLSAEVVMGRITVHLLKSSKDLQFDSFEGDGSGSGGSGGGAIERAFFQSPLVQNALDARLIEHYRDYFRRLPDETENWRQAEEASAYIEKKVESDKSVTNSLNRILFPVFSQAARAIGKLQMRRHLTGTSLRLLQDRARTGGFPTVIPNYGDVAMDPFSDERLKYRRQGSGFLLYSVGQDGADNDGKPRDPKNSSAPYDEVIEIK